MPYGGSLHGHVFRETNTQPGGRTDSKASTHMGPAFTGSGAKTNKDMKNGLGRPLRGKVPATAQAKQYRK